MSIVSRAVRAALAVAPLAAALASHACDAGAGPDAGTPPALDAGVDAPVATMCPRGAGDARPAQLALGDGYSCARTSDGAVRCWGASGWMRVDAGAPGADRYPTFVPCLTGVAEVSTAGIYSCARMTDGSARCWGGAPPSWGGMAPADVRVVANLANAFGVVAHREGACAWVADATLRCWGVTGERAAFVPGYSSVAGIAIGESHRCVRLIEGGVACTGQNTHGQLGDGTTIQRAALTDVPGLAAVAQVVAGRNHTCARLEDGTARCWGANDHGQLGDGTTMNRRSPADVVGLTEIAQLAAGAEHTCARLANGVLRCWGANGYGQVGDGTARDRPAATPVFEATHVAEVAAGGDHTCARFEDGTLRCWGSNLRGELGDGSTDPRLRPTLVRW